MTLFNSESRRKPSSSSPSGKLGARGPLSFLLPRKTQTQGQSDFEGHRIFLSVGVASPPSRDNGGQATHPYFPFSFLDRHTHTHTHAWIPMSFHTNAKGYLLETYIPPASDDLQRWPFVSRIFFFLFLFASLPDFRGCPGQTVLSPRIRGGSDEDDDGNDEITTLTWLASTTALSRTESRSGLPPWASSFQVYWRCTWLAFIHLANGLSRCAVQAGGRLGGRSRGERGLVCC